MRSFLCLLSYSLVWKFTPDIVNSPFGIILLLFFTLAFVQDIREIVK